MSNPILTTTNSKLDTRVKETSGVVPSPSGIGSPTPIDRFKRLFSFSKVSKVSYSCVFESHTVYAFLVLVNLKNNKVIKKKSYFSYFS